MVESLSKNVTRQGMTSTTLNYLRVRKEVYSMNDAALSASVRMWLQAPLNFMPAVAAVCHPGADAGADVAAQGVRAQPQGLPQNDALPEVAEDGCAAR